MRSSGVPGYSHRMLEANIHPSGLELTFGRLPGAGAATTGLWEVLLERTCGAHDPGDVKTSKICAIFPPYERHSRSLWMKSGVVDTADRRLCAE